MYDSSAKTLLKYYLDTFKAVENYKISLGKREPKVAMFDIDTLIVVEKNNDYDYIYI